MSIVSLKEIHDGRGGASGGIDDIDSQRCWRGITDNRFDDEFDVILYGISSGILPNLYSPHPSNAYLTARRVRGENQGDSPFHWIVTVDYSSKRLPEKEKDKESHANPTERPAVVGPWQTTMYSEAVSKDLDGKAIVNSAGDYFDPPPEVDRPRWTCSISKNVNSVPAWVTTLEAPVNDGAVTIGGLQIDDGKARVVGISISEKQEENGFSFYKFGLSIEFRKDGFKLELLDQGLRRRANDYDTNPRGGQIHCEIKNEDGDFSKVTSPVLLDGYGGQIPDPSPITAKYLKFMVIDKMDFNDLPLT